MTILTFSGVFRWMGAAATLFALSPASAQRQRSSDAWRTDFSRTTVDLAEVVPGGPPKDGIPAIDRPQFVPTAEASWLSPREPVVLVVNGGRAKIYPLQILIWHEIVNDVVSSLPVAVTYCPLCNTALVFDRRVNGQLLDFGTTGKLRHSDLVMYDRQTETWWQQATGEAIVGAMAGVRLTPVEAHLVAWRIARRYYPEAMVLSRETGYRRPYGRNPYLRYDDEKAGPFTNFFSRTTDQRLPAMQRVVTVELGGATVAFPFRRLRRQPVIHDTAGSEPLVVFWSPGTASPVDADSIGAGRDVGAVGVFDPQVDGGALVFESAGEGLFRDQYSGTVWNILGQAERGPLAGRSLRAIAHGNHFWFAWAAFRPETRLAE